MKSWFNFFFQIVKLLDPGKMHTFVKCSLKQLKFTGRKKCQKPFVLNNTFEIRLGFNSQFKSELNVVVIVLQYKKIIKN